MNARCFLCESEDGNHTPECNATPMGVVDPFDARAWRAGVAAAHAVMLAGDRLYKTRLTDEAAARLKNISPVTVRNARMMLFRMRGKNKEVLARLLQDLNL